MEGLFWGSFIGLVYSYFLYPLVLVVLPKRVVSQEPSDPQLPKISIILTAHNEESRIHAKLGNTLALSYPRELTEIIVASDASIDATDDIVRNYEQDGVRLVRAEVRRGKEYAQSLAIQASTGDIIVFTDVGTRIAADAVSKMVARFADPIVGAVSSEDRLLRSGGQVAGEGFYVKYEMWLRSLESSVNSLVGLSGSLFAARRPVCDAWDIGSPSDLVVAFNCARLGYVAVSEPGAIGYYEDISNELKEYQRKVRTVLRGLAGLFRNREILNPIRFGIFAFEVWSHKVMRWLVPWFLAGLLLSSVLSTPAGALYMSAAVAQICFYVAALAAWISKRLRARALFKVPFYFTQANAAIAHATVKFILGRRVVAWEPSRR